MKQIFTLNVSINYNYIAIACSLPEDYKKICVRYYSVNDDFTLTEITEYCNEVRKLGKLAQKWANKEDVILWSY